MRHAGNGQSANTHVFISPGLVVSGIAVDAPERHEPRLMSHESIDTCLSSSMWALGVGHSGAREADVEIDMSATSSRSCSELGHVS